MMRLVCRLSFALFLLTLALATTAQDTVATRLSGSRENEDTWLFRAGDSTGWANPAYRDRHWAKINPDVDLDENPALWQTGRGWFRQTFRFRRLRNKEVTITIRQFGKSEIYFDHRRIAVLKPARYDSGGSQRMTVLLPLGIADTNRHTVAVRYAFRRDPVLGAVVNKHPFTLSFDPGDRAVLDLLDGERQSAGITNLLMGIFGILSLLHFLFYRANPTQRVNRILGYTMLAFALSFLVDQTDHFTGTLTLDSVQGGLAWISFNAAFALLLLSLYTYLGRRPDWLFGVMMVLLAADALSNILVGHIPNYPSWLPVMLVLAEYIRVSWLAKRRNPDPDARLPWDSLKVTLYFLLAIMLVAILGGLLTSIFKLRDGYEWINIPMTVLVLVGMLTIPLSLSLSLVRDYARTYLSLRQKLDEVEQLSAQTLTYEQEKQQLLARQNEMLEQQVANRTAELRQSLTELRETQAQLIQREKLASLGELTAGIAHEIQNPLNFVNNFAEVSSELVGELREEETKVNRDPELVGELLDGLTQNLQKITYHGGRASSIVQGMLEHSRPSTGQREPTDLNALADEYLKLAYQGLQAKAKNGATARFNADLKTDFAPGLGLVEVVPQDIGRVLINLFNNAFYATQQRVRQNQPGYQPTVTVQTVQMGGHIQIRVLDNGAGMSEATKAKIFQPFFTTKPAGEGTGLGLSLSYDIITKGHGGAIDATSVENQGTEFVVKLPA